MGIKERITTRLNGERDDKSQKLWEVCQSVVSNVIQHNKLIISQMSNYDIHDQEHSEKVLEIIEQILGDKLSQLSFYELVLIYMAAYLHDSAMAMPSWEYNLLRAVEGTEECYDNTLPFHICNDFKPVHKFAEALQIVRDHQTQLFDFQTAKDYVCVRNSEEEIVDSLAELMCQYEEFRNGYIDNLKAARTSVAEYINMSQMIRTEFIRQTHHLRGVYNVRALQKKISSAVGERYSNYFVEDLAAVCRCHGENLESVFDLPVQRIDWRNETSNIQFVAMMLRLGDVIHFDSGRAPLSLFAEKQITDAVSFKHWNAKFQELEFGFYKEKDTVKLKFMAYCKEPEIYYFIQDYLDWVDNEIDNYYVLKNRWETAKISNFENYNLSLGTKVDRSEIQYDKTNFIPNKDMKFVLNQAKILELLMGVQLYKDEFLCLRELYQNALDASKCMQAYNRKYGKRENLYIEFGVGEEVIQGRKQKYIYCLDHGTGMDEYIINNYLLHIGNSYYKSRDFAKKNTDWSYDVKPTSQFGVGILSCYMLADKIGITTTYYDGNGETLSFILEGTSEHFYYVNPKRIEKERIDGHGTLVKLYLKPRYEEHINGKYLEKLPLALMSSESEMKERVCEPSILDGNLFYIISKHIGINYPEIPIVIRDDQNVVRENYYSNKIFDQRDYSAITNEDMEALWSEYHYLDGSPNPYKEIVAKREEIIDYPIRVAGENLRIYSHIALPKKGIGEYNAKLFDYCYFLGKRESHIFVDGVLVGDTIKFSDEMDEILGHDIIRNSILNYFGSNRPVLSVDRNSCVRMPEMKEELQFLRDEFVKELKNIVIHHITEEGMEAGDPESSMVVDIAVRKFPSLSGKLLKLLVTPDFMDLQFDHVFMQKNQYSLSDVFKKDEMILHDVEFISYQEASRQVLLGRIMNAEQLCVNDSEIQIKGGEYKEFPFAKRVYDYEHVSLSSIVVKADEWTGIYQDYDLVNTIWPIVNTQLYNQIQEGFEVEKITFRCKTISDAGNGLQGIASLDPVLIHPFLGISSKSERGMRKKECYVGEFDTIQKSYWLFELTNWGELTKDTKVSPVLFAYIAPRKLNAAEQERLKEYEESDPQYVKGIKEGWSILFLGAISKYVICPGIIARNRIAEQVPESFHKEKPEIRYVFTDGSPVF